jgi:hypothetical protein
MAVAIITILLMVLVVVVVLNSPRHHAAVAKRSARRHDFQVRRAGEKNRLHTAYNREHVKELRREHGFVEASRIARAEFKGTN